MLDQVLEHVLNRPGAPAALVDRLVATLTPRERQRARDRYLLIAAALSPVAPAYTTARALHARLKQLQRTRLGLPFDLGTVEGALASALRVDGRAPCVRTIRNLIAETQRVEVSASRVGHVEHDDDPEGWTAEPSR